MGCLGMSVVGWLGMPVLSNGYALQAARLGMYAGAATAAADAAGEKVFDLGPNATSSYLKEAVPKAFNAVKAGKYTDLIQKPGKEAIAAGLAAAGTVAAAATLGLGGERRRRRRRRRLVLLGESVDAPYLLD